MNRGLARGKDLDRILFRMCFLNSFYLSLPCPNPFTLYPSALFGHALLCSAVGKFNKMPFRRPSTFSEHREEQNALTPGSSPHTAPIEQERGFREAMQSTTRTGSNDRYAGGGREVGEGTHNRRMHNFKQRATDVAGRAGKGLMEKFKGSGNNSSEPTIAEEPYQFKLITLPLIEQTRMTRLRGRMSDAKDKTEFWMPALPYRSIE